MSVIVPFAGGRSSAVRLLETLAGLVTGPADELIVADNSTEGCFQALLSERTNPPVVGVRAAGWRSSYFARNVGAAAAAGGWLLFLDADCRVPGKLLADYLLEPVADSVGALAGAIEPAVEGTGPLARYARFARPLDQARFLTEPRGPFAVTANLLVRRNVWAELGGFAEVRSGGDVDFCWRLLEAGFSIEFRPAAVVEHHERDTLGSLARQRLRYGAGERWLARRWPGRRKLRQVLRGIARRSLGVLGAAVRGRWELALCELLDLFSVAAEAAGWLLDNVPGSWPSRDTVDPSSSGR